jgi:hypothetical protein
MNGFVIIANKAISRGEQVFDSYGRKCNSRFFVNYGFTLDQNEDNEGRFFFFFALIHSARDTLPFAAFFPFRFRSSGHAAWAVQGRQILRDETQVFIQPRIERISSSWFVSLLLRLMIARVVSPSL